MRPLFAALCFALAPLAAAAPVAVGHLTGDGAPPMGWDGAEPDPLFAEPYIDVDEWRTQPVPHRYVHGGFRGTQTRFSYYFPPAEAYEGRFFQHITPVPDSEHLAQAKPPGPFNPIGFAAASGAYFVETNGGGPVDFSVPGGTRSDPTITAWRANAAAAAYSRQVARAVYGLAARPYGYAYGGSGGGYRTIGGMEASRGIWDGAVPYVIGSTMAIPNVFAVRLRALRVLWHRFPAIVDALEPGGSGDPWAGLEARETATLWEATRMGFPLGAWFGYQTMGLHGLAALYQAVKAADPTYFQDFWTVPGYLGHDHPEEYADHLLVHEARVAAPVTAAEAARLRISLDPFRAAERGGVDTAFRQPPPGEAERIVGYRLAPPPDRVPEPFLGGDLRILEGSARGTSLAIARVVGDVAVLGIHDPRAAAAVHTGDRVVLDNRDLLALETYHRHQVPPGDEFPVWDQFRDAGGRPLYPQRPQLLGPLFVERTAGTTMTGRFAGKMIVVASLYDREAFPWQADWYRRRIARHLGDRLEERFRLYYVDRALHGDGPELEDPTRVVHYTGVLHQALRDLAAWVERGVAPPAGTRYRVADGQVLVPPTAAERAGLQPVVQLAVAGGEVAEVPAGAEVTFSGTVEAPPGAGLVTRVEWDLEGTGAFTASPAPSPAAKVAVTARHRYPRPGTYFAVLRGWIQRQGDPDDPYTQIAHLARVRVVVR
ncbi:MAG: hypothetical protein KatS3mg124_0119 [Porticoccaceae bacterium]|nr:MAG: hypothetical protein KatS3mg124_0119 [Porticoccaceae bacterium]